VERAVLFAPGPEASLADLGLTSASAPPAQAQSPTELNLENLERQAILAALERSEWVQSRAAKLLGVSPRAMVYKLAKHAIDHPRLSARRRR
jgi:DNA-binding NtrC family response regulator